MTAPLLSEIRARLERASPGPWTNECCDGLCPAGIFSKTADHPVCEVTRGEWGDEYPTLKMEGGSLDRTVTAVMEMTAYGKVSDEQAKANGDFIAHSRADVEALLAMIEMKDEALKDFVYGNGDIELARKALQIGHGGEGGEVGGPDKNYLREQNDRDWES